MLPLHLEHDERHDFCFLAQDSSAVSNAKGEQTPIGIEASTLQTASRVGFLFPAHRCRRRHSNVIRLSGL